MRLLNTDTMQDTSSHTQTQMSIDELQSQLKSREKKKKITPCTSRVSQDSIQHIAYAVFTQLGLP